MVKLKNNKTDEELAFSDDWEVVEEKNTKIRGRDFRALFRHWAKTNQIVCVKEDESRKLFRYDGDDDMLFYIGGSPSYGIGFCTKTALQGLEDGNLYSYCDLVGEE